MVEAERAELAEESEQRLEAEACCKELVKALEGALALISDELELSPTKLLDSSMFGRSIQMQEPRPQVAEALAWSAHNSDAPCPVTLLAPIFYVFFLLTWLLSGLSTPTPVSLTSKASQSKSWSLIRS